MSLEALDKAFDFISFLTQKDEYSPSVIIFGGEPLLKRPQQLEMVCQILLECERRGYTPQVITNGVELSSLWPRISRHRISRFQITIDGSREVHDARRKFPDGRGTFDRIVEGMDMALKSGVSVHLRVNIDLSNIVYLPQLAQIIQDRGWLKTGRLFTYLAPLQLKEGQYKGEEGSLVELLKKILELYRTHPETQVFDAFEFQPVLMIRQFLKERVLPLQFKQCGANNYQYLLGPYGDISVCLGTCGDDEYSIGTFYPELHIDEERLSAWRNRSILTIPECRECKFGPICGGGCSLKALKNTGILAAPHCPPLEPMLKLALEYYLPQLKACEPREIQIDKG
jgi:uncharacterized protein